MLKSYLKNIFKVASTGDAREESYYSTLENLLKAFADSIKRKEIHITTLPKKTEVGNPDFRIWDGKQHIVGYIEAKSPTVDYLDQIETTEQLKRYLGTFPNVILTNFFEFRLYRNGILIDEVLMARPFILQKLKTIPPVEKESDFFKLLDKFFSFSLPKVYDAKTLAIELAKRTGFLKDEVITEELKRVDQTEESKKAGQTEELKRVGQTFLSDHKAPVLHGFYEAFRKYLISGLTEEEFADLYSQTVTYGLFAARTRSEDGFNRKLAYDNIPRTIGILRDVFRFISLEDLAPQMEWIIDDISEVLAVTDVKKILHQYFHEGKGKDPIVHFYETFLAEYDPKTRERRGVYYTPEPVVSYIVRSLDKILKDHFSRKDGFASGSVTVLDPAAGTLTFLAEAAKVAVDQFTEKYGEGGKENLIKEHILKNFYAFELMMAPYAVGHLKMSFLLEELGYKLQKDDRFKLYLTNSLEMEELAQTELPGMVSLSEESHLAGTVKKETPILVILGNPPYSGISANINPWIDKLLKEDTDGLQSYYKVDGRPLREKNPKWLQDDYVKFIRFAQWKIEQAEEGVLGFITNHSYLDNPTFRGMRQSLMSSFNEIYILDLHGNSLKKEKCPDGSKDENVFDIRQGVAITLFIKKKNSLGQTFQPDNKPGQNEESKKVGQTFLSDLKDRTDKNVCSTSKVYHWEIWGLREKKYDWLLEKDIKTTKWQKLSPKSEFYLFVPREEKLLKTYEKFIKITDVFPVNSVGVVTSRDAFVIDTDKEALKRRIRMFCDEKMPDELIRETFKLRDKSNWKLKTARENVRKVENWQDSIMQILYRPFDVQSIFYHDSVIERSRREVMLHMMQENLALCVGRAGQVVGSDKPWNIVFCSECIEDFNLFYRGGNVNFPLFLYSDKDKKDLFSHKKETKEREPNINLQLLSTLSKIYKVGQTFLSDQKDKRTDKNVCSTNNENELKIRSRKLPHWTLKGVTYFVTFKTYKGKLSIDEQELILEHVKEGDSRFYTLIALVVMPDHVHLLLTPIKSYTLSRIMRGIKGVSAHKINLLRKTRRNVWQDESYDRIVRDQNELDEKLNYMFNNPVKKGLTENPWDYRGWYYYEDKQEFLPNEGRQEGLPYPESLSYQIFYYIYAVLYSNIYRAKYAEFLKTDFPRVPFTKNYKLFCKMGEYGKRLVDLHLLESPELDPPTARFQGKDNKTVLKLKYDKTRKQVHINPDRYFEGVTEDLWEYQIGGYQVLNKWLKDRKGQTLSLDDIKHYCKMVTAIKKTIEIQKKIDKLYPDMEGQTLQSDG
jgi:REP element-mobilizing transposase RayT